MPLDHRTPPPGPQGTPEFDELQRGQDDPITVETLEQAPAVYGDQGRREVPVPHPGERPGAVRISGPMDMSPAGPESERESG